jgi:ribosomal protein L29
MVVADTNPGLASINSAYEMAKAIQNMDFTKAMQSMHDAALRDLMVTELQNELLTAKSVQFGLVETVAALKKELAELKAKHSNKERGQLLEIGRKVTAAIHQDAVHKDTVHQDAVQLGNAEH